MMSPIPHGLRCDCDQCHEDHSVNQPGGSGRPLEARQIDDHLSDRCLGPVGVCGGQGRSQESVRTEGEVLIVYVLVAAIVAAILVAWLVLK